MLGGDIHTSTRSDWSAESYDSNIERGAQFDTTPALLPPETLREHWGNFTLEAISSTVQASSNANRARPEDPSHILEKSTHWNALASGDSSAVGPTWTQDPHIRTYLDRRAEQIHMKGEEFAEEYEKIADIFTKGIAEGRRLGYVPEEVTDSVVEDTVLSTGFQISDEYILYHEHDENVCGDYNQDTDIVRISSTIDEIVETTIHELRHRLSGGTFIARGTVAQGNRSKTARTRIGFQEKDRHRAIDEALVEHSTLAIINGSWDKLDPLERDEKESSYVTERIILADFINKSGGLISLKSMMRANFEDTVYGGGVTERRNMIKQVRSAYKDPATLSKLGELMDDAAEYAKTGDHEKLDELLGCIHAPVFDVDGNVIEKGWVDLEAKNKILAPVNNDSDALQLGV